MGQQAGPDGTMFFHSDCRQPRSDVRVHPRWSSDLVLARSSTATASLLPAISIRHFALASTCSFGCLLLYLLAGLSMPTDSEIAMLSLSERPIAGKNTRIPAAILIPLNATETLQTLA